MCYDEVGLRAQNIFTIQRLIINLINEGLCNHLRK